MNQSEKKATFLDSGQICLPAVNYTKIIDGRTLGRPIQVHGALYSIKKSCVITTDTNNNMVHKPYNAMFCHRIECNLSRTF